MERAKAKAQNDYAHEDYPASACVLDLNRYSIYIFLSYNECIKNTKKLNKKGAV